MSHRHKAQELRIERVYSMDAPATRTLKIAGIIYLIFSGITALIAMLGLTGSGILATIRPEGFIFARAFRTHVAPEGAMPVFHIFLLAFAAYRLMTGIMTYLNSGSAKKAATLGLLGKIDL